MIPAAQPLSKRPRLSAIRWPIAFKIAFTFDHRWVFRAWANCLAGFMAMITTPARIAMMPITTKSSISVKPRLIDLLLLLAAMFDLDFSHYTTERQILWRLSTPPHPHA